MLRLFRSNTYVYTKGAGKLFSQPGFVFHPGLYVGLGHTMNAIDPDAGTVPLVIQVTHTKKKCKHLLVVSE